MKAALKPSTAVLNSVADPRALITELEIQHRTAQLSERICADITGGDLVVIAILKGAFMFLADLSRHLEVPVEFDFMAVSSYGDSTKTSGVVRILKDLDTDINGRDVLLVEDIVDSGLTLSYLLRNLEARDPASLELCALLNKKEKRKISLPVKYEGFQVPDIFLVGYGLDYGQNYRNLPYVASLKK